MDESQRLHCMIEIPKGSRNKYEWDPDLQAIKLNRFLFSSVVYPTDYGFITDTLGEGGEALDALVLTGAPTFPGCLIEVRAVGVLRMDDEEGKADKVVCVPADDPAWDEVEGVEGLPGSCAPRSSTSTRCTSSRRARRSTSTAGRTAMSRSRRSMPVLKRFEEVSS
jgi:inorganic pyrophosphatase